MARKTKQQAQQTRELILQAAIERFASHGVASSSLSDIAKTAGVTRGAIYWHFANKGEIFSAIRELVFANVPDFQQLYQNGYANTPLLALREILVQILKSVVLHPQQRALAEIIFHKSELMVEFAQVEDDYRQGFLTVYQKITSALTCCIEHQQLPARLDVRRVAIAIRAYISGLLHNWLLIPDYFALDSLAEPMIDSFLQGFQQSSGWLSPAEG